MAAASLARGVALVGTVVAAILVVAILLYVLGASPSNGVVKAVHDAGHFLAGPFAGLFKLHDHKLKLAVNWGVAAVVWYALARLIARVIVRA